MIDIVIVSWNAGNLLKDCISSIIDSDNSDILNKIIIVDNHSTDDSIRNLPAHPKLELILNDQNEGFGKAANQGFRKCTSKYTLLLNPDTRLNKETLPECLRYMEAHNEVDVLGCQLTNNEGNPLPSCSRLPTPLTFFFEAGGLSRIAPKIFPPATLMLDWDHQSSRYVDQLMGAFMFMRSSLLTTVGHFDERFFVYFEDVDYAKRLSLGGYKSFFNASIKAYHIGKGTTAKVKAYRLSLYLTSKLQYAKKYFSKTGYWFTVLTTWLVEPFTRTFFFLFTGRFSEIKETWKGYYLFGTKKGNRITP